FAVMGDVAAGHDEVAVADLGGGFRRRSPRNREVFADFVLVADAQVTPDAFEIPIQRIVPQHGPRPDLVSLAEASPALDVDVWLQHAAGSDGYIGVYNAIFADAHARADRGPRIHARGRCDRRRGINPRHVSERRDRGL